jgi:tRNA pseudouridine55 synthase
MKLDLAQRTEMALDGVLVVNKPAGWTSHDVVARARVLLGVAKVGHTGTLDPAATGVLVLCLGKATRIAEYLVNADKEYRAVLRLGVATDTQDATGTVIAEAGGALPDRAAIEAVMGRFVGQHRQVPPMYSAVKIQGVPLYKSARAGRTVDRPAREYTVRSLQILSVIPTPPEAARAGHAQVGVGGAPRVPVAPSNATGDGLPPTTIDVTFDVVCSKGTYVRTLCADIGEALGVGGHLAGLERLRAGRFGIEDALTLDDLAALAGREAVGTRLHALVDVLDGVPVLTLDQRAADGVCHGVAAPAAQVIGMEGQWEAGACVRLQAADGRLLAIGKVPCGSVDLKQAAPGTVIALEKVLV